MESIVLSFGLILGYAIVCSLYGLIGLKKNNAYLRYSILVYVIAHSIAQLYLVYSKWKQILLKTDKLIYFQICVLVVGIVFLIINFFVDRYIIKSDRKKTVAYCTSYLDNLRLIAREKDASRDIQDVLKYMTPKKCVTEDEQIEKILNDLTEENMDESYEVLRKLITIREEKLKAQCKR